MVIFDAYADKKDKKIKPLVLGKHEFEHGEKNKLKMFSVEFSDYQESDAREKTLIFQLSTRVPVFGFSLRSWLRKTNNL